MTAAQSIKLYEIAFKHFKSESDAKVFVEQIEVIIENKIADKKDTFLIKDDKIDIIDRINKAKLETIIWIVGVGLLQFILFKIGK